LRVVREFSGTYLDIGERAWPEIVEVEAFLARTICGASRPGLTERTKSSCSVAGHAYVYFIYGMYHCMNGVTERGRSCVRRVAARHRAGERMSWAGPAAPACSCRAMHIDRRLNAHDLLSDDFFIATPPRGEPVVIVKRPRVGVDYARHWGEAAFAILHQGQPVCVAAMTKGALKSDASS